VGEYIRQYGPTIDIKSIKAIKEAKSRALAQTGEEGAGEDPVYEVKLSCPVCNKDGVIYYELRAKSQQMSQNRFLVPVYQGIAGFKSVDYTMLAAAVCPRCLFASPDKKDFNRTTVGPEGQSKTQIISNVVMGLQEKIGERKAILRSITNYEDYFKRPRPLDVALATYRLSMSRASVEAWYEQPYSLYKMGAYALRIAKIMKAAGVDNREILREALGYYEEAFRASNCPAEELEMQVIYTIVALALKLKEDKRAHSYIAVFTNLANTRSAEMRQNPKLTTVTIDKWADKAKWLWESRDMDDLFTNE